MTNDDDDFYEDDELVEDVVAAFEAGVPVDFSPPRPAHRFDDSRLTIGHLRFGSDGLTNVLAVGDQSHVSIS